MIQNAEGRIMVVNSEKALERKLKRPGNQISGGERGERGGTMGRGAQPGFV